MAVSRDCGDRGGEVAEGSSDSLQSLTAGLRDGCCLPPQHPGAPGMPRPGAASLPPSLHPHLATPPRCPRQHDVIWSCLLRAQLTPSCVLKRWGWGGRNVLGLMFTQAAGKVFYFICICLDFSLAQDRRSGHSPHFTCSPGPRGPHRLLVLGCEGSRPPPVCRGRGLLWGCLGQREGAHCAVRQAPGVSPGLHGWARLAAWALQVRGWAELGLGMGGVPSSGHGARATRPHTRTLADPGGGETLAGWGPRVRRAWACTCSRRVLCASWCC